MIWTRDRYLAHCRYEFTGREMFTELFGPLGALEDEWRAQGATEKEIGMTAFDWDYVLYTHLAGNCGAVTDREPVVIEDTPEHLIRVDAMGRTEKLIKKSATIPLPLDYPVKTMEDWLRVKPWYVFREDRVDPEKLREQRRLFDRGYLTILTVPGGFDEPRQLMGEAGLCMAYYDEPEMIEDMLATFADTTLRVIERIAEIVPVDNLSIHEEMAGKTGPLIGPNLVREFLAPYYKKVWDAARAAGAKLFSQDSDGNVNAVLDEFVACGVNCSYPCEPAGGMDIVALKKKYGKKLFFKGGIDKHALRFGKEDILRELEYKMSPFMKGGGTVFGLDHRIPNGVSLENYRYYVKTGREMLGLPPVREEGWARMAF